MALHKNLIEDNIHSAIWRFYSTSLDRIGDATLTTEDRYKLALQSDDNTVWILLDDTGPTWKQVTPDGAVALTSVVDFNAIKATAGTIAKGQAVYIVGYDVGNSAVQVELAENTSTSTMPCAGIAATSFDDTTPGNCRMHGKIEGVDTSAFAVNDFLHISDTPGILTDAHAVGPNLHQVVAKVVTVDGTTGIILVSVASAYDHLSDVTPQAVGTATSGTSAFSSRRDHVHAHGNQASDTNMHAAVVAAGASGFMTGTDKTKLDGIAAGAEVSKFRQSTKAELSASFSTSSTSFVDVLSISITTLASGILNIHADIGGAFSGNGNLFSRITVDGTQVGNACESHGHSAATAGVACSNHTRITGLSAASHTVKLQARVSASTFTADPTTADQGANLLVQEVTA